MTGERPLIYELNRGVYKGGGDAGIRRPPLGKTSPCPPLSDLLKGGRQMYFCTKISPAADNHSHFTPQFAKNAKTFRLRRAIIKF